MLTLEEVFHKLVDRVNVASEGERDELHESVNEYFRPADGNHAVPADSESVDS